MINILLIDKNKIDFTRDFIGISHWETLVAVILFFSIIFAFWYIIKKTKLKFQYRVFIGMGLGLLFGIIIQAIMKFPKTSMIDDSTSTYSEWVTQLSNWISLYKRIFITGITMLTIPIVFLALVRITSKKTDGKSNLARIGAKGLAILLFNVFIAFSVAFGLGALFKIGAGVDIKDAAVSTKEVTKTIPNIIISYIPENFIGTLGGKSIIAVIVLGILVGQAIKKMSKRYSEQMDGARKFIDTCWNITISILMFFVKLMPFAVMAMLSTAIIDRPIGNLSKIGIVIGVAYLALIIAMIWHLLTLWLFGVNPWKWIVRARSAIIAGFATQSSNAALPIALKSLQDDIKVKDEVVSTVMPLSTTMGLTGCAGVQGGIVVIFLYYSVIAVQPQPIMSLGTIYILGLIITLVVSLGVAGVPGTAGVVTAGVLGGLGFGTFFGSIYGIIGALDGLFDMGRTAANISGGMQATTIVARTENMIDDPTLLNKKYFFQPLGKWITKIKINRNNKKQNKKE